MREAVGGTMLFWIVLTFVAIFIGFMAAVAQYAKIYRIKNAMINYIEQGEGIANSDHLGKFEDKLIELGYGEVRPNRYVLCKDIFDGPTREGAYYYLVLFVRFQIPYAPVLTLPVSGDTRLVETGARINSTEQIGWTPSSRYGKDCYSNQSTLLSG